MATRTRTRTVTEDSVGEALAGIRVLVVEDNADARDMMAAVLSRAGAIVTTASSADEAIATFRTESPDVLLCDLHMPVTDGFELIHRVRQLEKTAGTAGRRIPAAAVSAYASIAQRLRHGRDEFQAFLTKPIEPEELVAVVARLFRSGE